MILTSLIIAAATAAGKQGFQAIKQNKAMNQDELILEQCGKRPLFIGKRRNEYNACVNALPMVQNAGTDELINFTPPTGNGNFIDFINRQNFTPGGTTPPTPGTGGTFLEQHGTKILIGGAAFAALYLITKKK